MKTLHRIIGLSIGIVLMMPYESKALTITNGKLIDHQEHHDISLAGMNLKTNNYLTSTPIMIGAYAENQSGKPGTNIKSTGYISYKINNTTGSTKRYVISKAQCVFEQNCTSNVDTIDLEKNGEASDDTEIFTVQYFAQETDIEEETVISINSDYTNQYSKSIGSISVRK